MVDESNFMPGNDGGDERDKSVDPFVAEVHTGKRVLSFVNDLLDRRPDHLESTAQVHLEAAETTRKIWENMLEKLSPEEQLAFKCALAQGLDDFYHAHYNALRKRLNEEKT